MSRLNKELIVEAQKNTKSHSEASRYLGIAYMTYRKYAQMWGLWESHLNPEGLGISKGRGKKSKHKTIRKANVSTKRFIKEKRCRTCDETNASMFYSSKNNICKPCLSKERAKRWENDKDLRDRKKIRSSSNEYKKKASEYHFKNRDRRLRLQKEYYKRTYHLRKHEQREYEQQPHVAAARFIRGEVHRVLSKIGTKKEKHSVEYVDYTPMELKEHIESLFQPGMSWDNHGMGTGKWQIDHKKEVAQYIKEGVTDINTINRLDNLQPLWTEDHAIKTGAFQSRYYKEKS